MDSILTALGFDADSTILTFLRYVRNNQADYKATVTNLDVAVSSRATQTGLDSVKGYLDTEIAGIKTKTDQLAFTTRGVEAAVKELDEDSAAIDLDCTSVSAVCGGSGIYAVYIQVLDNADSTTAVSSYDLAVYDSTSNTLQGQDATDPSGYASFSLDAGGYYVNGHGDLWDDITDSGFTVSAADTLTYYVDNIVMAASSPTECRVWCKCMPLSGNTSCRLTAQIPSEYGRVTTSGFVITPYQVSDTVSTTTDTLYLDVPRSSEMTSSTGNTVKILFELTSGGHTVADTLMAIPDSTSVHLWH